MFTVECQLSHRTARGTVATYRTSRQPHVPAALAYARATFTATAPAWRHNATLVATLRDDAGRVVHTWQWRRV